MTHTTTGRAAREGRQERAAKRAGERTGRSAEFQLMLLAKRPGKSAKETARLVATTRDQ